MTVTFESLYEQEHLQEMSYPCPKRLGYGIIIQVNGNDHGIIGNENSPAHAHVYDTNKNLAGEIVITEDAPKKPSDVVPYRCILPDGIAKRVCNYAGGKDELPNNWETLKKHWIDRNG